MIIHYRTGLVRHRLFCVLTAGGCRAFVRREHNKQVQCERIEDEERPRAPISQDALGENENAAFDVVEVLVRPCSFLGVGSEGEAASFEPEDLPFPEMLRTGSSPPRTSSGIC